MTDAQADDALRWKVYGERTVYDNPWVRLNLVDVQPPGDGPRFEHHVVRLQRVAIYRLANLGALRIRGARRPHHGNGRPVRCQREHPGLGRRMPRPHGS